jgi:tRNA threonylcarbamoyladenosine biosynthesis protein TsaE
MKPLVMISRSEEETHAVGVRLGQELAIPSVVLLRGSLGAGKTTLTRGLAQGLGIDDPTRVSSPSFSLVNIYQGRCPIYHVDLYRLDGARDIFTTGLDEFLGRDGVTIVEWSERLVFPVEAALVVEIDDSGGETRTIRIHHPERGDKRRFGGADRIKAGNRDHRRRTQ